MDKSEFPQRIMAAKLANDLNASKTLQLIDDQTKHIGEILRSAADEIGTDRLVSCILENDPVWAINALKYLPNLGKHRDALVAMSQKLMPDTADAIQPETVNGVPPSVQYVELYLISGAAFECHFTMFWQSAPDVNQPWAGDPTQKGWIWSDKLSISINRSYTYDCAHFQIPNCPLAVGDRVWLNVSIVCGNWYSVTQVPFIYAQNGQTGRVNTWGASVDPKFGYNA